MVVDYVIDKFVDTFDEKLSVLLLKSIALPEQGGQSLGRDRWL
jgi:hypothetical protein